MAFVDRYGPWAMVTGASAGIGAEFARQLATRGLNLVLLARREGRLIDLARELSRKHKIEARPIAVDLARHDFVDAVLPAIDSIEIGLLVNNAGFGLAGDFFAHDLRRELDMVDVNCRAQIALTYVLGNRMIRRKKGGIIFVSSVSAFVATPYEGSYSASKVHELFFAEALRFELRARGVQVLALCPGSTDTEFHELAGSRAVAAMAVEPVVRFALESLGKRGVAIPGWHNRMLVYLLKCTPRRLHTFFAGRVMRNLANQSDVLSGR